jgi:bifunctional UDP-N-acetylglucosamine pyrophosphorylase/glucosamine-1-phosphate N-acetyltransferase
MLLHVLDALAALPLERIVVVVGHDAERVVKTVHEQLVSSIPLEFVEQRVQRGTGDAASVGLTAFADELDADADVIVLAGDGPLLRSQTLAALATEHRLADVAATLLTTELSDPTGYGRIVRDSRGFVQHIVEQADANAEQLEITEVNPSIYCFRQAFLAPALRRLSPENAQGEYYITDVVEVLHQAGHLVLGVPADDPKETFQVSDRADLAVVESLLRERINDRWMREGVTMTDAASTYIDASVELAADVRLLPNTILEGRTVVGTGSIIGPSTQLIDTIVGEECVIRQTVAREAEIGHGTTIGPWASLRPGTRIAPSVHIGTFVETKNAEIGEGAKIPHLSYVGDAEIGEGANIGAGTITANYDGEHKHQTKIGARAHTGSNTVLVAPVEVGDDAYTGAGAVVNRDVPPGALAKGVPATIEKDWTHRRGERTTGEPGIETGAGEPWTDPSGTDG